MKKGKSSKWNGAARRLHIQEQLEQQDMHIAEIQKKKRELDDQRLAECIRPTGLTFSGRVPVPLCANTYDYFLRVDGEIFAVRAKNRVIKLNVIDYAAGIVMHSASTAPDICYRTLTSINYFDGHLYILHHAVLKDRMSIMTKYDCVAKKFELLEPKCGYGVDIVPKKSYVCDDHIIISERLYGYTAYSYDTVNGVLISRPIGMHVGVDVYGDKVIYIMNDGSVRLYTKKLEHLYSAAAATIPNGDLIECHRGLIQIIKREHDLSSENVYVYDDELRKYVERDQSAANLLMFDNPCIDLTLNTYDSHSSTEIYDIKLSSRSDILILDAGHWYHFESSTWTARQPTVRDDIISVDSTIYVMREWHPREYRRALVGMDDMQLRAFRHTVVFLYWIFHKQLGFPPDVAHFIMTFIIL